MSSSPDGVTRPPSRSSASWRGARALVFGLALLIAVTPRTHVTPGDAFRHPGEDSTAGPLLAAVAISAVGGDRLVLSRRGAVRDGLPAHGRANADPRP